ncbi:hypothetical protein Hdeb2414_s0003g00115151 [Helianthus debilis subsp. tardiflorus]
MVISLKMSCIPCLVFTFIMLMMIGMVKGRWLEVEPYSTTSMVSDGIDYDMSHNDNPSGYLRIGDSSTLDVGEGWMREGNQALFLLLGNYKKIGESVYRLLMALPRIVLVVVDVNPRVAAGC